MARVLPLGIYSETSLLRI